MKTLSSSALVMLVLVSLSLAAAGAGRQAQAKNDDKDKQLRLKADLVQVRAVVTDKRGQPVSGLKKEDFELLEENRPQEISFFSAEDVGIASNSERNPDSVRSLRAPTENVARTIVLFVDTVHTSFENVDQTKRALRRFVDEQMTDEDLVALITSSGSLGLMEQFTRNRQLLRAGIERLAAWNASTQETLFTPYLAAEISRGDRRSLFLGMEILRTEEVMQKEVRDELLEPMVKGRANQILAEASNRRRITLATLKGVVERVAEMPGQRMIAIFSEGFTLASYGGGLEPNDLQAPISRAVRSGVVIYTIAAQGLKPLMIPASQPGIVSGRRRENPATRVEIADPSTTMAASERDVQIALGILAKDTGGESFFNTNDLNSRLQKALNDNRIYYAIGYHASNESPTDSRKQFRRISLRVKNHPEYKIRTQRGYQPLEDKTEAVALTPRQKLVQAMGAPLPVTTIPVAVSADYFERENLAGQAYIQIYIDASALRYRQQEGRYFFDLDTAITIYDVTGKRVHVSTNVANGSFTPERLEIAKRNGYRYTERVALKPGIYQTRIGILETSTEQIGTATAWLEVPDFTKRPLTLSAILLTRGQDASNPSPKTASQVESLSPAVTQGITIYNPGADLDYHLVIHTGAGKELRPSDLQIRLEVAQGDRTIYQGQWASVEPRVVEKDSKGIEIGGSLTLNGIRPGVYELRVAVKSPNSKKPVQRVVAFGVEP
jgi:VWFA-related protein